jgi:hypothetical protein
MSNTASHVSQVVDISIELLTQLTQYQSIVATMHAEGRTELNDSEKAAIRAMDDQARARLVAAIGAAP